MEATGVDAAARRVVAGRVVGALWGVEVDAGSAKADAGGCECECECDRDRQAELLEPELGTATVSFDCRCSRQFYSIDRVLVGGWSRGEGAKRLIRQCYGISYVGIVRS